MLVKLLTLGPRLLASAEGGAESVSFLGVTIYLAIVLAVIFVTMKLSKPGITNRVITNKLTLLYEHVYLFVENLCVGIIGAHGRKYIPLIMTLWLVIFVSNFLALFFPTAPTAVLSFNLGMALLCVFYVQYEGIRVNGLLGHFKHFAGPKLGGFMIIISGMIFVIEIISEIMKNMSLSLRLFGNIHGGHEAVTKMNVLGKGIYLPIGAFLIVIKLMTSIVQALIFTLLTCVYLSLVTHHEEEAHDDHKTDAHAKAAA